MVLKAFPHQKDGIRWMVACRNRFAGGVRQKGCILADEMGLGKTFEALVTAKIHKAVDPTCRVFVICPKSLIRNWEREAAMHGIVLDGVYSDHVVSFPGEAEGNYIVIVDEGHRFQTLTSQRTQKLLGLVRLAGCQSVYILTGTPAKNGRPINLMPLLIAVNHGIVQGNQKQYDYKQRFCGPKRVFTGYRMVWTFDGATHLDELHSLTQPSILRRTKAECLNLPEKIRTLRDAELSDGEKAEYRTMIDRMKAEYKQRLREGKIKGGGDKLVALGQLRLAGSLAKVNTAIELADEVLEEGGQVVLYTCFVESAQRLARHYGVTALDGSLTSPDARQKLVDDFQAGKQKVFVMTGAGGVGITLTAGQTVILLDRPWTPGDALQVEDRCHRIGQTGTVACVWLQFDVDHYVDGILEGKAENIEKLLTGTAKSLEFVSEADIAAEVLARLGWDE
jgi:SNF2 family DNA or RNA helicase